VVSVYVASYLTVRKTPLGQKGYLATEDFYTGKTTLHKPFRSEFKNIGEITYVYLFLPLSTIDYKLHGHAYVF